MSSMIEFLHVNQTPQLNREKRQHSFGDESDSSDYSDCGGVPPRHKSSHNAFLVWLVWGHDAPRRICPLMGCEKTFDSQEEMQQHVIHCLQDSYGFYRCFKCKQAERIGKYHVGNDCQVQNHGGPFAKICNLGRSARRMLSSKTLGSKSQVSEHFHASDSGKLVGRGPHEMGDSKAHSGYTDHEMSGGDVLRPTELPTPQNSLENYASSEFRRVSTPNESTVAPHGYPIYQQPQTWQNTENQQSQSTGNNCWPSGYATEDVDSPCSPVSPAEPNGWQSFAPTSPTKDDGGPNFRFGRFDTRQETRGSVVSMNVQDFNTTTNSTRVGSWGNQTWSEILNSTQSMGAQYGSPNETPGLSDGTNSRDTSISTQFENPPSEVSSAMILGGSNFCAEPDDYDYPSEPFGFELDSVERVELPVHEHKAIPTLENDFVSYHAPVDLQNSSAQIQAHLEESFDSYQQQSSNTQNSFSASSPSAPNSTSPNRTASRRPIYRDSCICGYVPGGFQKNRKGNLKRHRRACKILNQQEHPEIPLDPKPFVCQFPNCGRGFGRRDNLGAHQKLKQHLPVASMSATPEAQWVNDGGEMEYLHGGFHSNHSVWS